MTVRSPENTLARLAGASQGLLFPSESDFPFEPLRLGAAEPSPASLLAALGRAADTPVETITPAELFEPLIETLEGEEADRYRGLVELLSSELSDVRVYRVGRTDIDIFVVGRDSSGEWLGLSTKAVET